MRRVVAARALSALRRSTMQRMIRSSPSLPAVRTVTTSRGRLAAERKTSGGTTSLPYEEWWAELKDLARNRGAVTLASDFFMVVFYTALFGRIAYKLMPRRMRPDALLSESVGILADHHEVTTRIGSPVSVSSESSEQVGLPINHVELKDAHGNSRLRIKFDLEGPDGHAEAYAEIAEGSKKGEFVYLILKFTETEEVVKIYDNRHL